MTAYYEQTDAGFTCITGIGSRQPKSISFHSDGNIRQLLRNDEATLLYYRHFATVFDALAHKLMLENLCDTSLNCVISRMNPGWEDLRESLWEELTTRVYGENE